VPNGWACVHKHRYPQPISDISAIAQRDLSALPADEQRQALADFEARLRGWSAAMKRIGGGGPVEVSVEIPAYKGGWLMPCIESVLYQSSACWALSIRWDGGDDLSRRILEIVERSAHPKLIVHFGENRGIAYNRRFLTEHSKGRYILPLDDDDMLAPNAVERFLHFAESAPWSGIVRAKRDFIDEIGHPVDSDPWFPFEARHYQYGMVQDVFNHSQPTIMSRAAYERTAGWEGFEEFKNAGEDCDVYLKIEEVAPIELLDEVLYHYRISDKRTSLVLTDTAAFEMWRRLTDRSIKRIGLPLKRVNDTPPFTFERHTRPALTRSSVDAVIVANGARDRAAVARTRASLHRCGVPETAVRVVDTGSNHAAKCNDGFRRSARPVVCFLAAGVEFADADAIDKMLALMERREADVVAPRIVSGGKIGASWLPSRALLARREVMRAVGGFDEEYSAAMMADADFTMKARQRNFACIEAPAVAVSGHEYKMKKPVRTDLARFSGKWRNYQALLQPIVETAVEPSEPESEPFDVLYHRGVALMESGQHDKAETVFRRVIALNRHFSWAFHSLGDTLRETQRWTDAVGAYQRAIELHPDLSWSHHHMGSVLLQLERWEEAAPAFQKAIALEPGIASAYDHLGHALTKLERWTEAVVAYQQALDLGGGTVWTYNGIAEAQSTLERWPEAAHAYERAIDIDPALMWSHHNLATVYLKLERWSDAAASSRRAIALDATIAKSFTLLGRALSCLNQLPEAVSEFQRSVNLDPTELWAWVGLAEALTRLNRADEATDAYRRAVELAPGIYWIHSNLGRSLAKQEAWEEAGAAYRRALALKPDDALTHVGLGRVASKLGDWAEAANSYERAVRFDPTSAGSSSILAEALMETGRKEEMVAVFRRILELKPEAPWAYQALGDALCRLERFGQAISALQRSIQLDPTLFWSYHQLGYALLKLSRWEDSADALRRSIALKPNMASAHHHLGNALLKLGKVEEAAASFLRAVELKPHLSWMHNNLGDALMKLERWEEAAAAYERTTALDPKMSVAQHSLGDALTRLGRWDAAAAAYERADALNPAWTRRPIEPEAFAVERWVQTLIPPAADAADDGQRLLFVFDSDYGEVTTAMFMLLGQNMAARSTLLVPSRLYVTNKDVLPGRTQVYGSAEDVMRAVEKERPDIVFLCSGYLFSIHEIFTLDTLQQLVDDLTARGCQVVTTDPFLGLLAKLGSSTTVSIDIPDQAPPQLVKVKHEQDRRLNEHFTRSFGIFRDTPHLYPVFPAHPDADPSQNDVKSISFFNPNLIVPADVGAPNPSGTPQWVFVLASRDYELQTIFHGRPWFINLLAAKIEETVEAGRHPVFIGPYDCVQAVAARLASAAGPSTKHGVTLMTFCSFARYCALQLSAEYVFYWNALSHSMFLRLFNERPVFLFDKGHLVRNVIPLYERIVQWYYQGWDPIFIDQDQPLVADALAPLADAYREGARSIGPFLRRAPAPEQMIDELGTTQSRESGAMSANPGSR